VLHLDLWHRGLNVLRDGGSYSYNAEPEAMRYFSGTASHNTVQFDGRDQMPRLGPFLFGAWPDCSELHFDGGIPMVRAAYRDSWGASHRRSVELTKDACVVCDEIADFRAQAVLRWRLAPATWRLEGMTVRSPLGALSITSSTTPAGATMVDGWESLHYGSRAQIPVLEVVFDRPAKVTTTIRFDGAP
jgi:hypothetical protein